MDDHADEAPEQQKPPPVVTYLAIAISVLFFVQDDWKYVATAWDIYDGSVWSLVTSAFYHVGIMHIAFNVYWLWVLGRVLEREVGTIRYLLFFVAAAWVSSAAELVVSDQTGVGLSGVGYALFGAMWFARARVPAFERVVDEQVIGLFVLWLFLCLGH